MARSRHHDRQQDEAPPAPPHSAATQRSDDPAPQASEPATGFPSGTLVDTVPSPALVIGPDRRIEAVNQRFCDAFGLHNARLYAGEPFAEFARRMSLSGAVGFVALGALFSDQPVPDIEVVSNHGMVLAVRACRSDDGRCLVTLFAETRKNIKTRDEIALNILDNMPGSLMRILRDPDGHFRCVFASPLSGPLFGVWNTVLTAPGTNFLEFIAEPHRQTFIDAAAKGDSGATAIDLELQVRQADGNVLWVRCVGATLPGDGGSVICDVRMIDIEKRRHVLEERHRLQDLLDLVVDSIPFPLTVRDVRDRSVIIVNRAFEELSGHDRKDIVGRSEIRLFPGPDIQDRDERERNLINGGQQVDYTERQLQSPTGDIRIVNTRKYPLYGDSGDVLYILTLSEDITERRQAVDALRRGEQRFRDAIESLTDGIALFDQDEKLVLCNNRYRAMWPGYDNVAVPGVSFEALVRIYLELAVENGRDIDIEAEIPRRIEGFRNPPSTEEVPLYNGRWLQVARRASADGGIVVTCTDITALKEREASLRYANREALFAKEAAEEANRAKSDFLANMSHELRTPLNAVIGFSEIIKEAMLGNGDIDAYRGYASDIHESGRHLLSLINDILDMSKIEAGKIELVEEAVDLPDAIDTSLRLVRERAHQNGVNLVADVPSDLPDLLADLRKIKQIVINLLSNAVKFTPRGGRVTVGAFLSERGELVLRVSDTGIGIAEKDIETVLAPFGQADAGLDRQYEGTGLGLSLTKALAELHGGRLEIASRTTEPDRGTIIDIAFPPERIIRSS